MAKKDIVNELQMMMDKQAEMLSEAEELVPGTRRRFFQILFLFLTNDIANDEKTASACRVLAETYKEHSAFYETQQPQVVTEEV